MKGVAGIVWNALADGFNQWDSLGDDEKRKVSIDLLAALDAAGYVVRPKTPTQEMVLAGLKSGHCDDCECGAHWHIIEPEECYEAMNAVAPKVAP